MTIPKILVVDDLQQNLHALEQQISDLGADIVCVDSGEAALEVLLTESFSLILLDIQMPNMDGFELAETIRLSPKHKNTPLIFLTAIDTDDIYIFKGYEKGAVDFIQKPIRPEILRSKVSVFIEIARKNALIAASELKHRLLVELSSLGITLTRQDGQFLDSNQSFHAISGFTKAELTGVNYWALLPALDQAEERTKLRETKHLASIETLLVQRDGRQVPVKISAVPIKDSDHGHAIWSVFEDISAQKEHERVLENARTEAEAANRAKSDFLAAISHEIRTPMNGILGMTELAMATPLDSNQRHYLELVQLSANNLLVLINDILDFSKIEAEKLAIEASEFSLSDVLESLTQSLLPQAEAKDIRLDLRIEKHIPDHLFGDSLRLMQIMTNLVSNAVKFTHEGGVLLKVTQQELSPDHVDIDFNVIDTGIGIPQDKISSIFNAFTQADTSVTRKYGGTGLGLAICHRLATLMGGDIKVESKEGLGSRFTLRLRFALPPSASATSPVQAIPPNPETTAVVSNQLRILLAEDNIVNQQFAKTLLSEAGHEVVIAENGQTAINCARHEAFDVILMDVQMPLIDGFEATQAIRNLGIQTPIIALTAHAIKGFRDKCLAAGMDEYMTKPVRGCDLQRVLSQILRTQ